MSDLTPRERLKRRLRRTAREIADELDGRDTCVRCGDGPYVEIHHIDGDPFNNHPMNLAPVCYACHKKLHRMKRTAARLNEMRTEAAALGSD